jgi:hypothetical protein
VHPAAVSPAPAPADARASAPRSKAAASSLAPDTSPADPPAVRHRLAGLRPDNLLAFLALVGLMRALEADAAGGGPALGARAAWTLDEPPLRPTKTSADCRT